MSFSREKELSAMFRGAVLDHLVQARRNLLTYDIHSDWNFGVSDEKVREAVNAVVKALNALDWHRVEVMR